MEPTKNICYTKGEGAVVYSTVSRWVEKFCSGYKNLNDQIRLDRPKTVDSKAMLQAIEANPVSYNQRVSGKFSITFMTLGKASEVAKLYLMLPKY